MLPFLFIYNKKLIMKYLKIFENLTKYPDGMIGGNLTSKTDKLEKIKNDINALLNTYGDKQINFIYTPGNKGFYFSTTGGNLIDDKGQQCTTFNELNSNMETILYTLQILNSKNIITDN